MPRSQLAEQLRVEVRIRHLRNLARGDRTQGRRAPSTFEQRALADTAPGPNLSHRGAVHLG